MVVFRWIVMRTIKLKNKHQNGKSRETKNEWETPCQALFSSFIVINYQQNALHVFYNSTRDTRTDHIENQKFSANAFPKREQEKTKKVLLPCAAIFDEWMTWKISQNLVQTNERKTKHHNQSENVKKKKYFFPHCDQLFAFHWKLA